MTPYSLDIVRRIAVEVLNVPDSTLMTATTLQEAGIDSLGVLDLVLAVEGYFSILISADEINQMGSLADLAACVDRLISAEALRHDE